MAWGYQLFESGEIAGVLPELHNAIKLLNKSEAMSAKAETADAKDDQARGVLFHDSQVVYNAVPDLPGGTWSMDQWSDVNPRVALDRATEKLNALSKAQAFYAKVVYSDAKYQPATVAVFWPEPA